MIVICLCVLLTAFISYLRDVYSRFSKHGVGYFKPIPVLGNVGSLTLRQWHAAEDIQKLYNAFPNDRFVGRYELMRPLVVIRDLELIKLVTIKDYEYFYNHRRITDDTVDPLFGRNLFSLKDKEWREMRAALSPVFTSSKMRAMVPLMIEASHHMINVIKKKILESETGYVDLECGDLTGRLSSDIIASCAFGVMTESQIDTANEFYRYGKASSAFNFRKMMVYLGYSSFPGLMKKLKMTFFDAKSSRFFTHLFLNAFSERSKSNMTRLDVIHYLMEAKKGKLTYDEKVQSQDTGYATVEESDIDKKTVHREWSDNDLVAQAVMFLAAGLETISSAMDFILYELALHPDIQNRLLEEIREDERQNDGKFSFASIQSMKYLDMVVSEVLRLWPPAIGMDRMCTKNYNMGKPNDKAANDFIVRIGDYIHMPLWAIQRDPNNFPDPEKFDPERFSQENKAKIKPFSFMPFGSGPRSCAGSRFTLCELKVMISQLLLQLEVSPCEKTRTPAKLATDTFNVHMEGGLWLRFRIRT